MKRQDFLDLLNHRGNKLSEKDMAGWRPCKRVSFLKIIKTLIDSSIFLKNSQMIFKSTKTSYLHLRKLGMHNKKSTLIFHFLLLALLELGKDLRELKNVLLYTYWSIELAPLCICVGSCFHNRLYIVLHPCHM